MAGKYSRFKLFGNKVPKYLLPLGSETMLAEVIKQYLASAPNCKIYLIANRNDQIFYPIVRSIMNKYGINPKYLIYIDDTSSQLETALTAQDLLDQNQLTSPVAFANIDTILIDRSGFFRDLEKVQPEIGIIDTFKGASKQYSYARIDNTNIVVDVVDKNVISTNACSGLYGFGSYSIMAKTATELLKANGESSFSNLYQKYITLGRRVYAHYEDDLGKTIVLGTPEEYVINIHRFK
jgi:dTDP-glucose pyrophosphorylase